MELNITELDHYDNFDNTFVFNQDDNKLSFEEIPENSEYIKGIKKGVSFEEPFKPINQSVPKENARMIRPKTPNSRPQISYEDILSKMGMFVLDGKLHLLENKNQMQQNQQQYQNQQTKIQQNIPPNNYIYNKYFKEEIQQVDNIRKPMTKNEYKMMLLQDILQKERIKQIKSRRLIMPTSNINIASSNSANLNKLFNFPKK